MNQLYVYIYPFPLEPPSPPPSYPQVIREHRVELPLLCSRFLLAIYFAHGSVYMGSPGSSACKESTCNEGDPSSISRSGRSPGEGIGYPLQFSWASLVVQMVKNLSAVQETWVGKIPWRRAWLPIPVFLPGESHGRKCLVVCSPWVCKQSDTTEELSKALLLLNRFSRVRLCATP